MSDHGCKKKSGLYRNLLFCSEKESEDSEHGQMKYAFQVIRVQMAVSVEDLIRRLNIYGRRVVFLGDGVPVYRKMLEKGLKVPYFLRRHI